MTRPYNFSAGPAAIPDAVLIQAASEMLDWHGSGMGVMEMSHRGKEFMSIYEEAEADLRDRQPRPRGDQLHVRPADGDAQRRGRGNAEPRRAARPAVQRGLYAGSGGGERGVGGCCPTLIRPSGTFSHQGRRRTGGDYPSTGRSARWCRIASSL